MKFVTVPLYVMRERSCYPDGKVCSNVFEIVHWVAAAELHVWSVGPTDHSVEGDRILGNVGQPRVRLGSAV